MRTMTLTLFVGLFASVAQGQEKEGGAQNLSPDKKWDYRLVDGSAAIVRVATGDTALKIKGDGTLLEGEIGEVLWAPDSRRVAVNYRAGTRYSTCAIYELAGDKWKALPDLETKATKVSEMIARSEQRQRKRLGATKNAYRRRLDDTWKVARWLDADTFEALATSEATVVVNADKDEIGSLGITVLFTVKCDNRGGWRITRLHEPSADELNKLNTDQ